MRLSELANIKASDIDWEDYTMIMWHIPGGEPHHIHLLYQPLQASDSSLPRSHFAIPGAFFSPLIVGSPQEILYLLL